MIISKYSAETTSKIKAGINMAFSFFDTQKKFEFPIVFAYSREEFDNLVGQKTENWVVARSINGKVVIFTPEKIEECTTHKITEFLQIICHETCHIIHEKINKNFSFWIFEGIALNVANQKRVANIKEENINYFVDNCLFSNPNYEDFISHQGYNISYMITNYILEKFGKGIFMELLKVKYYKNKSSQEEVCKILKLDKDKIIRLTKNILYNKTA